jgi:protoporphyrin/coproporphyrin ferrochelatase
MNGVLLMAYGAAAGVEEIPAFLADIRQGRPVEPELVDEFRKRYERMGGGSPLAEITAAQARALRGRLGDGFRVGFGMRHCAPRIADGLAGLTRDCASVVGLPLTPFASRMSTGAYFEKFMEAARALGYPRVLRAPSFHDHPRLIEALADRTLRALERTGKDAVVLFTVHSMPAGLEAQGDPYPRQVRETAALVAQRLDLAGWQLAFQSRPRVGGDWLGPEAGEAIAKLAAQGVRSLVLSPIGFVSDNLETLYDVDVLYREQAESLGLRFGRAAALNDHPAFIDALADTARAALGTSGAPRSY